MFAACCVVGSLVLLLTYDSIAQLQAFENFQLTLTPIEDWMIVCALSHYVAECTITVSQWICVAQTPLSIRISSLGSTGCGMKILISSLINLVSRIEIGNIFCVFLAQDKSNLQTPANTQKVQFA